MTRERPLSILILALVSVVVGGLGIFTGTAALGKQSLLLATDLLPFRDQDPSLPSFRVDYEVPEKEAVDLLTNLEMLAGGIVLVVVSIGLLHMRPWARWLGVAYGLVTLFWHAAYATFQIALVLPAIDMVYRNQMPRPYYYGSNSSDSMKIGFFLFLIIQLGVFIGHAGGLLTVLALPSVGAAFAGKPPAENKKSRPAAADRAAAAVGSV